MNKCPQCGKNTIEDFKPFCSARCSTIDLGKWLGEHYRVRGEEDNASKTPQEDEKGE